MKTSITCLALLLLLLASCNKEKENAMDISGIWAIEETIVTDYADNLPLGDSVVVQSGKMIFTVSDKLDNPCTNNLEYAPAISYCHWSLPKKKRDQVFFYYYDDVSVSIYSSSCMISKLTRKKLELVVVAYDNDLNILRKSTWKFRREAL